MRCDAVIRRADVYYGAVDRAPLKIRGFPRCTVGAHRSHTVETTYGWGQSRLRQLTALAAKNQRCHTQSYGPLTSLRRMCSDVPLVFDLLTFGVWLPPLNQLLHTEYNVRTLKHRGSTPYITRTKCRQDISPTTSY